MTLEDLDRTLPNGLHDAVIVTMMRDYQRALVELTVRLDTGLPGSEDEDSQRIGKILFIGVPLCTVEIPDAESAYRHPGGIWFLFSRMEPNVWPEQITKSFPSEMLLYSLFILDWSSYIHIAATEIAFSWVDSDSLV